MLKTLPLFKVAKLSKEDQQVLFIRDSEIRAKAIVRANNDTQKSSSEIAAEDAQIKKEIARMQEEEHIAMEDVNLSNFVPQSANSVRVEEEEQIESIWD